MVWQLLQSSGCINFYSDNTEFENEADQPACNVFRIVSGGRTTLFYLLGT
jgi:hypothetical protein